MGQRLSARVSPIFWDIEGWQCDPPQVIVGGNIVPAPPNVFGRWWVGKEITRAVMGIIPIALDTMMLSDLCLRRRTVSYWW